MNHVASAEILAILLAISQLAGIPKKSHLWVGLPSTPHQASSPMSQLPPCCRHLVVEQCMRATTDQLLCATNALACPAAGAQAVQASRAGVDLKGIVSQMSGSLALMTGSFVISRRCHRSQITDHRSQNIGPTHLPASEW